MRARVTGRRRGPAVAAAWFLVVAACGGLRGADDRVGAAAAGEQPEEIVRFAPAGNVQVIGQGIPKEYDLGLLFDQQVFGRSRTAQAVVVNNAVVIRKPATTPDDTTLAKLSELRGRGEARVRRLEQACGLSAGQRTALELALASDLRRVAGEIDAVRRTYAGQRIARQRLPVEQERLQAMHQDAIRCRGLIDQAFRKGSLMAVVAVEILAPDQRRRLAAWVQGRRASRWEAAVRLALDQLDETVLGLSRRQHQGLLDVLLADTPPLAVLDDDRLARDPTSFHTMLVLARLGRAGERVVRPLLDPRQWAELERRITQAGQPAEAVEGMLAGQGILEPASESAAEEVP